MIVRHPGAVVLLSICTLTLYAFFWLYETTEELKRVTRDRSLQPAMDVVLALVTCGVWGLYASYRNAKLARRTLAERGVDREDRTVVIGVLNLATLFVGWTWLVSMALIQEDLNALAEVVGPPSESPLPSSVEPVVF